MTGCQSPLVEVLSFFCWALLPYYLCDGMGWSGIVALVAAGIIMDIYVVGDKDLAGEASNSMGSVAEIKTRKAFIFAKGGHMSQLARNHVGFVTLIYSTLMETAIFTYLGLFLFSKKFRWSFGYSILSIFSIIASRGAMVFIFSHLSNWISKHKRLCALLQSQEVLSSSSKNIYGPKSFHTAPLIDRRMQLMLWFSGLRGAMSFALVENIPLYDPKTGFGSRFKPQLKAMTSASVVFSVFILGGSTFYLLELLGFTTKRNERLSDELLEPMLPSSPACENDHKNGDHYIERLSEESKSHSVPYV